MPMKRFNIAPLLAGAVGALSLAAAGDVTAATFTSFAGDVDCFGLGGSCADGLGYVSDLGGTFFDDHSTGSDPLGTDHWDAWDTVTFNLGFAGSGATSAVVDLRIAGVADFTRGPYDVFFNGVSVGQIPTNLDGNASEEVLSHSYLVPVGLLQANNTVSFTASDQGDGWSLDFVRLTVQGGVPEPAAWALMIMGFAAVGGQLRARRGLFA
jgi:hypothetical protein